MIVFTSPLHSGISVFIFVSTMAKDSINLKVHNRHCDNIIKWIYRIIFQWNDRVVKLYLCIDVCVSRHLTAYSNAETEVQEAE